MVIENLDEMTREHGGELREQTLEYVAQALRRELRRFDRIGRGGQSLMGSDDDLLIILPGADGPRGRDRRPARARAAAHDQGRSPRHTLATARVGGLGGVARGRQRTEPAGTGARGDAPGQRR